MTTSSYDASWEDDDELLMDLGVWKASGKIHLAGYAEEQESNDWIWRDADISIVSWKPGQTKHPSIYRKALLSDRNLLGATHVYPTGIVSISTSPITGKAQSVFYTDEDSAIYEYSLAHSVGLFGFGDHPADEKHSETDRGWRFTPIVMGLPRFGPPNADMPERQKAESPEPQAAPGEDIAPREESVPLKAKRCEIPKGLVWTFGVSAICLMGALLFTLVSWMWIDSAAMSAGLVVSGGFLLICGTILSRSEKYVDVGPS